MSKSDPQSTVDKKQPHDRPAIGVMFANGAASADPERATALAVAAEDLGFDSLWAVQHVVMPVGHESRYPYAASGVVPGGVHVAIPDPLVWLAFVAARTHRIALATGILVLPQQHALVVAKQVATLDRLSGGRLILGVGAGWLAEEFAALDVPFEDRGRRLDEQIDVLRRAWSEPETSFAGTTMTFGPVIVEPKPVQRRVPIVIGGHTSAAEARAARIGDGFFPLGLRGAELVSSVARVRSAAVAVGRDPSAVEITADAPRTVEQAEAIFQCGARRVLINAPAGDGSVRDALLRARDDVNSKFETLER
jgi:probable F420-dependent oxidoreductase